MKKTLSLILLIASIGYLIAVDPAATEISTLSPTTGNRGTVRVTFTFGSTPTVVTGSFIIFSTSEPISETETATYTFTSTPTAGESFTQPINFSGTGTYNVYLKNANVGASPVKQTGAGLSIVISPSLTEITGITPQMATINTQLAILFALPSTIGLAINDKVVFAQSSTLTGAESTEQYTLTAVPSTSAPLNPNFTFTKTGTYNLFVVRGSLQAQQTGMSIVVNPAAPANNIITAVTPTTATAGTAASLSFTLSSIDALTSDEKIVFSTASAPTSSDLSISVTTPTSTTYPASVTFKAAGTYTVWVDNGSATQQSGLSIVVAAGASFISMTVAFAAFLLLL